MDIQLAVGENIHRIRKSQNLSMDRLAELSGVSKSMLGQMERGTVNPTISVLSKIARGLHVPLEMLTEKREEMETVLYRGVDVLGQRLCGGKVIRYPLVPFDTDSRSESAQFDIFISGSYEPTDLIPGTRVYLTVLSGLLEVETDGQVYHMENRDSLVFPGSRPYRYVNKGNNTVRLMQRIYYKK